MNAIRIEFLQRGCPGATTVFRAKGRISLCGPDGRVASAILDEMNALDLHYAEGRQRIVFYVLEPHYQNLMSSFVMPDESANTERWAPMDFHGGMYIGKRGWVSGHVELAAEDGRVFFATDISADTARGCTCDATWYG